MERLDGTRRRRARRLGPVLIVALLVPAGRAASAGASGHDLTVQSIEVTQAIQTTTNTIQLVARRSTAVRATIEITGNSGNPVAGVTGELHVFVGGVEVTPVAGVLPINAPLNAPDSPQRANENHTLNFELAAPTAIGPSADVDVRVDITPVPGEVNTANNSGQVNDLSFVEKATPSLFFTRINWTPSGLGVPDLADVQAGRGDAFVRGIYPVDDGDPNLYRQGLFPTLTYPEDTDGDGSLEEVNEGNNLLSLLASCRQLIVDNGLGPDNGTFLYGWIAGNPIDGNGLGQISGFNAYGNTQATRHQRSYAHELGHNVGIGPHNNRTLDEVGWDVGGRLPGNPAGNNTTGRVKPTSLFDIMRGGQVTNSAWVDTITYNFFLTGSTIAGLGAGGDEGKFVEEVAVIQGIFARSGERLRRLEPVFRFPWPSQPTPARRTGRFRAFIETVQGTQLEVPFSAGVHGDGRKEGARQGFFEIMVDVPGAISALAITDRTGEQTFRKLTASRALPEIEIVSPAPESTLGRRTTVEWKASDADTRQRRLWFQAAYSPDGGTTFVPIAVDVRGDSFTFNSRQIQASDGRGLIRVFASDGLNTSFADVGGLSTRAARF